MPAFKMHLPFGLWNESVVLMGGKLGMDERFCRLGSALLMM